jgi:hypothetical protein
MQNKAIFYFHFDIFIFENKVAEVQKMQLDGQFALKQAFAQYFSGNNNMLETVIFQKVIPGDTNY